MKDNVSAAALKVYGLFNSDLKYHSVGYILKYTFLTSVKCTSVALTLQIRAALILPLLPSLSSCSTS